jgi:antitoxin (DNA-binding transcriptional repressor) of toxin-antitoxin stability system
MSLLETVNAMRDNVTQANAIIAQITPLHAEFQKDLANIAGLDKSKMYFGINEDGTATILDFDPTPGPSFGAPRFNNALPLPAEPVLVAEPEPAAEIVPLAPQS